MNQTRESISPVLGPVERRQPGDDLDHICAVHDDDPECDEGVGCRSYCGIDLSGGIGWDTFDLDDEADAPMCVVCHAMCEAECV